MKKIGQRKTGGRNNRGRITVRHRGGGQKRMKREIEYREGGHMIEMGGVIKRIEYDPSRTAYVGECEGYKRKSYKIVGGREGEEKIGREIRVVKIKEVGVG
jgi:large subunit ribosomal protein L2